jgi:hypothetical protein
VGKSGSGIGFGLCIAWHDYYFRIALEEKYVGISPGCASHGLFSDNGCGNNFHVHHFRHKGYAKLLARRDDYWFNNAIECVFFVSIFKRSERTCLIKNRMVGLFRVVSI